jgi:hypothetical protein
VARHLTQRHRSTAARRVELFRQTVHASAEEGYIVGCGRRVAVASPWLKERVALAGGVEGPSAAARSTRRSNVERRSTISFDTSARSSATGESDQEMKVDG